MVISQSGKRLERSNVVGNGVMTYGLDIIANVKGAE